MVVERQVVVLYALVKGYMDDISIDKIKEFEEGLINYTENNAKKFYKEVLETKTWSEKSEEELKKAIGDFKNNFLKS